MKVFKVESNHAVIREGYEIASEMLCSLDLNEHSRVEIEKIKASVNCHRCRSEGVS